MVIIIRTNLQIVILHSFIQYLGGRFIDFILSIHHFSPLIQMDLSAFEEQLILHIHFGPSLAEN